MNGAISDETNGGVIAKLPIIAAVIALIGLGDAAYLTIHHLTATPVPCSLTGGCEMVLASEYAEIRGIPLAAFGGAAYFVAFSLSTLAVFGNATAWKLFGLLTGFMAIFSLYLLYVQAYVIKAFCQFCLLSAATSLTLFVIYLISIFVSRRSNPSI